MRNAATPSRAKSAARILELKPARTAPRPRRPEIHPLDRAIAELRKELARTPDDSTLHARVGALQYRRGDLAEALEYYRRAVELQPNRPSYHNNLGNVLCDLGRMKDGIAAYEKAMALERAANPSQGPSAEAETNLELAKLEYRLIHERIEYLESAVRLDVDSAEALNALGGGYLLRNQRERALEVYRRAAQLDPRNADAALNLAFAQTLDLAGPGDVTGALAELAECAVRFPREPRLFLHQGELLEGAGLLDDAEEKYARALRADARCLEAYDLLGRLREAAGTAVARDATARAVDSILGRLLSEAQAAQERAGAAAGPVPAYDLAFVEVARARFERRPLRGAAEVDALLREAWNAAQTDDEALARVSVDAAVLRAHLLEADGRKDEAAQVLDAACERLPQSGRPWFERGGLALRMGEIALAVEVFERAILARPQEAVPYQSLRFAFEGYRRYRTERVRFEAAMRNHPHDPLAHHHLALAALSVLKDEEALFHFTRALELDPRLAEAACGRARALQRQGHPQEAEAAYRKALVVDPACAEALRALQHLAARKPAAE